MEQNRPVTGHDAVRPDVEAALGARRELGPEYDEAIAAGLAERVEQLAAARSAELAHVARSGSTGDEVERSARTQRFVLGIISLGIGVPVTAISASNVEPGLLGVVASWAGIVGVNAVFALGNRPRGRQR